MSGTPFLYMSLDATLSNRSKEMCCTPSPFLMSPLWLPTFLNHPSFVWWAPLSSAPDTNELSLSDYLMVFVFLSCSFYFSSIYPLLMSLQNPCMEMPQINPCSTAVLVEQQSTESLFMGTGRRRFTLKTIPVSSSSSVCPSCHLGCIARIKNKSEDILFSAFFCHIIPWKKPIELALL